MIFENIFFTFLTTTTMTTTMTTTTTTTMTMSTTTTMMMMIVVVRLVEIDRLVEKFITFFIWWPFDQLFIAIVYLLLGQKW